MSNLQSNASRPNAAPNPNTKAEEERYAKLKKKAERFRVLIIGGANAGKTTILKKICNTTDNPKIYNSRGQKIDTSKLEPTTLRGEHDIESEMVFQSNPTLVFHDSRGFEAGGVDEFKKVKSFVAEHAKGKTMKEQVHVIWYCIPMDDDRPITYAENQFFSESGTGKVPVIVVFTKCEALELKAISALGLEDELDGCDFDEVQKEITKYVEEYLKKVQKTLEGMKYPPHGYVYLQELQKPEKDCQGLVKSTVDVLDSNILQGLFISTQQNSLELAMEYSLRKGIKTALQFRGQVMDHNLKVQMLKDVLKYFPYHHGEMAMGDMIYGGVMGSVGGGYDDLRKALSAARQEFEAKGSANLNDLFKPDIIKSLDNFASTLQSFPVTSKLLAYTCALSIIAEHLSVIWSTKPVSANDIPPVISLYRASSSCSNIAKAVKDEFSASGKIRTSNTLALSLLPVILANRLDKTNM